MSEQNPQPPPASAPSGGDLAFPGTLLVACPLSRLAAALAALERREAELPWARLRGALAHGGRGKAAGRACRERGEAQARAGIIAPRRRREGKGWRP